MLKYTSQHSHGEKYYIKYKPIMLQKKKIKKKEIGHLNSLRAYPHKILSNYKR